MNVNGLPTNIRGILWMLAATALFSGTNSLAKLMGQDYHVVQVVWARYAFHLAFLVVILRGTIFPALRTSYLPLQLTRSTCLLMASMLYFYGFTLLPLAESAAMINITPILVTMLSAVVLREIVGIRRWTGVVIGFVGALVVIRPGLSEVSGAAVFPLSAAFAYALYQIATRRVSQNDSPMTSIIYTAVVGTIAGSAIVPFFWTSPDATGWLIMCGLGITGATGHYFMIRAYSIAEASAAAPFTYAAILWMIIMGYLVFGDLPDLFTLVGAAIIAASGLYIAKREREKKQS